MSMHTVTRLYDDYSDAQQVVRDLETAGIPQGDISLIAHNSDPAKSVSGESNAGSGAGIGAVVGGGAGLLAGLGMLAIPGIGPVVAAGWLASTLAGLAVGAGAGGIIGAMTGAGIEERDAHVFAEAVRRGGALVTVRVDEANLDRVNAVLQGHQAIDASVRRSEYESTGWSGYRDNDATAAGVDASAGLLGVGLAGAGASAGMVPPPAIGPTGRRIVQDDSPLRHAADPGPPPTGRPKRGA